MKIATYNVHGIDTRLASFSRWLDKASPDIVCLQELKSSQKVFPERAILDMGYSSVWNGHQHWNGVAILSRIGKPLEIRRSLPEDAENLHSRYIEATINGIVIGCLHIPDATPALRSSHRLKLAWIERFIIHARTFTELKAPVILVGDYHVLLTGYKPARWIDEALFRPEARTAFQHLINLGWSDLIREHDRSRSFRVLWDHLKNFYIKDRGLRIDHFLINKRINERLLSCGVDRYVCDWKKSSAQAPVWLRLRQ